MTSELPIPIDFRLASRRQNRELDRQTIENFGISGFTLMEIAGREAALAIHEKFQINNSGLFFCGKGNNAGDALAAARYLSDQFSHQVTICFIDGTDDLSPDANKNLRLLQQLENGNINILKSLNEFEKNSCDYIVDGLLGTGLSSPIREKYTEAVELINNYGKPVYSLDIPTGLDCDTGKIQGKAVKADHTLTFGARKTGFYLNNGPETCGEIKLIRLPFPSHLHPKNICLINTQLAEYYGPVIRSAEHKYQNGTVHIVAGSEGLSGAAIMTAKSAWKSGAGAVILYTPEKLLPVYETVLPEIIKLPVGTESDAHFKPAHLEKILTSVKQKPGVLAVGPGIGSNPGTKEFITELLIKSNCPSLIDADALSAWKELKKAGADLKMKWLFTPHPGELSKYFEINEKDDAARLDELRQFSEKNGVSILSKGYPVILSDNQGDAFITGYDTRIFARAGFGDTLTGTIAAYIAITNSINQSAIHALISGYQTYQKLNNKADFRPSHLL